MYDQLSKYFDSLLATNQCRFRKGFSSQYCLLVMLEKFMEATDRGNQFEALLIDLSKGFYCIDHKLLIAKLSEYDLSSSALNVISSYLKHRTQRTKINDCFSTRSNIEYGVSQGSILGSLLFDINMIDLFYQCEENYIGNYDDDTTPYSCGTDIPTVISELQDISTKVFNLIGICNKVSRKINALGRMANYVPLEKPLIVMKTFIESQFNYCPLIWIFHSRTINNKINRLHERALRIVYSDSKYSFEGLIMKDNSFSIHESNIYILAIEIYKFLNGLCPSFLNNVFHKNISNN